MTAQDRRAAKEIADRFVRQYEGEYIAREAADTISAALQKAREEERERCAKIADEWLELFGNLAIAYVPARDYAVGVVKDIADAIRLPSPPQSTEKKP